MSTVAPVMIENPDFPLWGLPDALARLATDPDMDPSHVSAMRRLCESGEAAFDRGHYSPGHFTASAFVLAPDERHLLLILHQKLGMWLQPGGHIEKSDEGFVAAAQRELLEETGLSDVTVLSTLFDLDVHVIPSFPSSPSHLHHDLRVLLQAGSTEIHAGDGALAARWFSFDEILDHDHLLGEGAKTDDSVRRVAARLARNH